MEPLTSFLLSFFRTFAFFAALGCTVFGCMYVFSPNAARRVSQTINRTVLTLDTALGRRPRVIGGILHSVGIPLFYLVYLMF